MSGSHTSADLHGVTVLQRVVVFVVWLDQLSESHEMLEKSCVVTEIEPQGLICV